MARKPKLDAEINIDDPTILCKDMDSDCLSVEDHQKCWLHQPELGICPFLWCNTDHLDKREKK
jgi:hypothetical protein